MIVHYGPDDEPLAVVPCRRCGGEPCVSDPPHALGFAVVYCAECYDGAPDSPTRGSACAGRTLLEAVSWWTEQQADHWHTGTKGGG